MKRLFDIFVSFFGLLFVSPFLLGAALLIWLQDCKLPLYFATRMKTRSETFRMVKLRSMVHKADEKGGSSTSALDPRITPIGRVIRSCKLDELSQLWNVLVGDMSLVGPRPQEPDHCRRIWAF